MRLLLAAAVLLALAAASSSRPATSIPGCPNLDVLEAEAETSPDFLNNLLLCFCKVCLLERPFTVHLCGFSPSYSVR